MPRASKRCVSGTQHCCLCQDGVATSATGCAPFLGAVLLASCKTLAISSISRAVVRQVGIFTAPLHEFPPSLRALHCC